MRGNRNDEPPSGTRPSGTNGAVNFAVSAAYTRSQCSNIVTPMPTAAPFTAATMGFSKSTMPFKNRNTALSSPVGGLFMKS